MKNLIYKGLSVLAIVALCASCADDAVKDFTVPAPEGMDKLEQLNSYNPIKSYVDQSQYPNLKMGAALSGQAFVEGEIIRAVAPTNFDEITPDGDLFMANVVKDDGSTNFKPVTDLLSAAEESNVSVYGHAIAWHSKQALTWLNSVIADIKPEHTEENLKVDCDIDFSTYAEGDAPFPQITTGFSPTVQGGVLVAPYPKKKYSYYISPVFEDLQVGVQYEITFDCLCTDKEKMTIVFGDASKSFLPDIEWTTFTFKLYATKPVDGFWIDAGRYKGTLSFNNVRVTHYPERPQTPEEKAANLTVAMNTWCNALMEANEGRIKAWDVINEPIASTGDVVLNGKNCYDLLHAADGGKNDFFWQDYFGSENYGPVVAKAARDAWSANGGDPAELKLFVNEKGLDNVEDDNKKLTSLIEWVSVWEAKGAKIDGLGAQLHTVFSEDRAVIKDRADHIVKMLHKMADTGKLVRISALDMSYQDIRGNSLSSAALTEEQHQNMANFYRFIIQMYLKIVPAAQQYSICQWSVVDSSLPTGLWSTDWQRKVAYISYCEALSTPIAGSEDYFDYLSQAGLSHYVSPEVAPAE